MPEFMFLTSHTILTNSTLQTLIMLMSSSQISKVLLLVMVLLTITTTALQPMLKWDTGTHFTVMKFTMLWLQTTATMVAWVWILMPLVKTSFPNSMNLHQVWTFMTSSAFAGVLDHTHKHHKINTHTPLLITLHSYKTQTHPSHHALLETQSLNISIALMLEQPWIFQKPSKTGNSAICASTLSTQETLMVPNGFMRHFKASTECFTTQVTLMVQSQPLEPRTGLLHLDGK